MIYQKKYISKVVWAFVDTVAAVFLPIITLLFIGKFISPSDYGKFSSLLIIIAPMVIIIEGLFFDVILAAEKDEKFENRLCSTHGFLVIMSLLFALILCAIYNTKWPYEINVAEHNFYIMAACLVVHGYCSTPQALIFKNADFKLMASRTIVGRLVAMLGGAILAYFGDPIDALTFLYASNLAVSFLFLNKIMPNWLHLGFNFSYLTDWMGNSCFSAINLIISIANKKFLSFVIAASMSSSSFGLYEMANRLCETFSNTFQSIAKKVAIPIYMGGEGSAFSDEKFWKISFFTLAICIPFFIASSFLAEIFLSHLFNSSWGNLNEIVAVLLLVYAVGASRYYIFDYFNSTGFMKLNAAANICTLILIGLFYLIFKINSIRDVCFFCLLIKLTEVFVFYFFKIKYVDLKMRAISRYFILSIVVFGLCLSVLWKI